MNTAEAFTVLADADRRRVVVALLETETTTIDALAERVADRRSQNDGDAEPDAADLFDRVKVALVHNHLPRLADHGVIEYDARNGDVVLEDATALEPYLEADETTASVAPSNE